MQRSVSGELVTKALLTINWENIPGGFQLKNAIITTSISRKYLTWNGEALFEGCIFKGKFDLPYLNVKRRLLFLGCTFEDVFDIRASTLSEIVFTNSAAGQQTIFNGAAKFANCSISGPIICVRSCFRAEANFNTITVGSIANFKETSFLGSADFKGAKVLSQLDFSKAQFLNPSAEVSFNSATFLGGGIFDEAEFMAAPDFLATEFRRRLQCFKTKFLSQAETTFQRCRVTGDAILEGSIFAGPVDFSAVHIEGDISLKKAIFKDSAHFGSMLIEGNAFFQEASFFGQTVFSAAEIRNNLVCDRVQFVGDNAHLSLQALRSHGNVSFRKSSFAGPADFSGVAISGQLGLEETQFAGFLSLNGAKVGRGVFLMRAICNDSVNGVGAEIGGQFACQDAKFVSDKEITFSVANINCNAMLDRAEVHGPLTLTGTIITGQLICIAAKFVSKQTCFNFSGGRVEGAAVFWNAQFEGAARFRGSAFSQNLSLAGVKFGGPLDVSNASVEGSLLLFSVSDGVTPRIETAKTILPPTANLHRFRYMASDLFEGNRWREWIKFAHGKSYYDPDPFLILERSFRRSGRSDLADRVYYEMNNAEARVLYASGRMGKWLIKVSLKAVVGYGVYGSRLSLWALPPPIVFFITCLLNHRAINPFRSLMYTLDTFLPVDLHQSTLCDVPNWMRFTNELWGWLIVPLTIAQLSGYLKRKAFPGDD